MSDAMVTAAAPIPTPEPAPTLHSPSMRPDGDHYRRRAPSPSFAASSEPAVEPMRAASAFDIVGDDDDVPPMRVGGHTLFIGLPSAECRLMAELLSAGDVGYELSLDPITPVVVGVYPMRPVPRG
jgi:hypothetical protein